MAVLLLYGDSRVGGAQDIAAKLLGDERIARVDLFDFNAQVPPRALA